MKAIVRAEWFDENKQAYDVPILHFFEDNTALIIHKREFIRVPLSALRFSRFND